MSPDLQWRKYESPVVHARILIRRASVNVQEQNAVYIIQCTEQVHQKFIGYASNTVPKSVA